MTAVHRPGAAEGVHGQLPRVLAAFPEVCAGGVGHVLVDDLVDAPGHLLHAHVELAGHRAEGLSCRVHVELHLPAEKIVRVEVAQDEVCVGDRGARAATAVAGRPRLGAGAVRPHLEKPQGVHPGDAAAAGADLDHVDDRDLDGKAAALAEAVDPVHLELPGLQRIAVLHRAELGGGAAHVEGEEIGIARALPQSGRRQRSRRRPRFQHAHREAGGRLGRADAAAGEHHEEAAAETQAVQPLLKFLQIGRHALLHVDVGGGGAGALELADLGHHVGAHRHPDVRRHLGDELLRAALVGGVAEAVEIAHRHRPHVLVPKLGHETAHEVLVQRCKNAAVGGDALGHIETEVARHQGLGELEIQIVELVAVLAADLQGVPEPFGGEQRGEGPLALDQGIGDQRGAVHHGARLATVHDAGLQPLAHGGFHRHARIAVGGEGLADEGGAVIRHQQQIREGSAYVNADTVHGGRTTAAIARTGPSGRRSDRPPPGAATGS